MGQEVHAAPTLQVHVDARDIARRLMTSTVTIEGIDAGPLDLWFPKYIPGNHCASGPIQNVGGLHVRDSNGNELVWDRDPAESRRIMVRVPEGSTSVQIETTYITNQPASVSRSSDSYGFPAFGAINWNTAVWYPEGVDLKTVRANARVTMPDGWQGVGAGFTQEGATLERQDVQLMELIDTPVVFGLYMETHALDAPHGRRHFVHSVGHDAMRGALPQWMLPRMNAMLAEAEMIFGPFRRENYHFLILCDDSLRFGLEHGRSTFVSAGTDELLDAADEPDDDALEAGMSGLTVLPHEYIHAWNGKLASPLDIVRPDYHDPIDGTLLWVYEGLTTYYTHVLAVRAGMISPEEYESQLTTSIERYAHQEGRLWRSIEDTARDVVHVRVPSPNWGDLRRRADYYGDGALFWLEADAIIRRSTQGAKSLDDFCRRFYDVPVLPVGGHHGYTRDDIVRTLGEVLPTEDWDALIQKRIETPVKTLAYDRMLKELGRALVHTQDKSALQRKAEKRNTGINLSTGIGFSVNREGAIGSIRRGSPADDAGFAHDMRIMAVDGAVFAPRVLRDRIAATPATGKVVLLIAEGEQVREITIHYADGMTYPHLVQAEGEPNLLEAIIAPRRDHAAK